MSHENQQYSWKNQKYDSNPQGVGDVEGEQALSISTIRCWIAIFKDGEEEIKDKACFGHPCKAVTSGKNCQG